MACMNIYKNMSAIKILMCAYGMCIHYAFHSEGKNSFF